MSAITTTAMNARADGKDRWLSESLGRGAGSLVGRITPAGERAFYFRYTNQQGKRHNLKLGSFDPQGRAGLTVAQARQRAVEWSAKHAQVADLREHLEREAASAHAAQVVAEEAAKLATLERERRLTVRQLFDRWASVDLQPRIGADGKRTGRKDGGEYTRQQFERHVFPTVGEIAVADLRRADLMAVLDRPKADGKLRTANVLLTDLKQMLRFALHREIVERNVLDTVEKRAVGGREVERERVLSPAELRALAVQVPTAGMEARSALAIWIILGTACRVGELMNSRWEHVSLEAGTWYIPPEHSKNQRDHTVHLSPFALEQFAQLAALRERDTTGLVPWVFPNRLGNGPVCVKSFGKQIRDRQRADPAQRLSRRTKATGSLTLPGGAWTAHDLRRTAATIMASLGIHSDVIDECLNHIVERRVTRVYIRDRREADQARAFDALGAQLRAFLTGEASTTNVVRLHAA